MPYGPIHENAGMGVPRHGRGDFGNMHIHCVGITDRQNKQE